jgi:hypothetical protein
MSKPSVLGVGGLVEGRGSRPAAERRSTVVEGSGNGEHQYVMSQPTRQSAKPDYRTSPGFQVSLLGGTT